MKRALTIIKKIVPVFLLLSLLAYPQKTFSDTPNNTTLSIDASAVLGNNGWYTTAVPVTLTAGGGTNPVQNITNWIDTGTPIVSTSNPTLKTLVQQGSHTLKYFSTDSTNLKEATRSFGYKIDVVAPSNWNSFNLTQSGNNHTFNISVKISDKTSGLDPTSAEFQYSVDDGNTWGYYSNLTQCSSTWNDNLWKSTTITPNTAGTSSATINIPTTDYCNSNWAQTKYIRIRIKDMAGLMSTKQYALMSPWMQTTGGDVYSQGGVDMLVEYGPTAAGAVITANDMQNNLTSSQGWSVLNYPLNNAQLYNTYFNKFGSTAQTLPSSLPTSPNVYKTNDFSLTSVPNQVTTIQNQAFVVFVDGDLFIDTNVQLQPTATVMWVVSGDIGIRHNVTRADGIYIADGNFESTYDGDSDSALTINGLIAASNGIRLTRSLRGNDNLTNSAEKIYFPIGIFTNPALANLMKINNGITWKEYITY